METSVMHKYGMGTDDLLDKAWDDMQFEVCMIQPSITANTIYSASGMKTV